MARHSIQLAPGVTAEVAITGDGQVQLVLPPGPLTISAVSAGMLALGLESAARIAGERRAALDLRQTSARPRMTLEEVAAHRVVHKVEPANPVAGPELGGRTRRRRAGKETR